MAWLDGSVFFGGLRGQALYEARLRGEKVIGFRTYFAEEFGRIRAVAAGPDGMLYIATSNRDRRALASERDDRILRIDLGYRTQQTRNR